jgi:hypothetical protein
MATIGRSGLRASISIFSGFSNNYIQEAESERATVLDGRDLIEVLNDMSYSSAPHSIRLIGR